MEVIIFLIVSGGAFVTLRKRGIVSEDYFRPSTVILGLDEKNQIETQIEYDFQIPKSIR